MLTLTEEKVISWFSAYAKTDVPANGDVCIKYEETQIAVFHFLRRGE